MQTCSSSQAIPYEILERQGAHLIIDYEIFIRLNTFRASFYERLSSSVMLTHNNVNIKPSPLHCSRLHYTRAFTRHQAQIMAA